MSLRLLDWPERPVQELVQIAMRPAPWEQGHVEQR